MPLPSRTMHWPGTGFLRVPRGLPVSSPSCRRPPSVPCQLASCPLRDRLPGARPDWLPGRRACPAQGKQPGRVQRPWEPAPERGAWGSGHSLPGARLPSEREPEPRCPSPSGREQSVRAWASGRSSKPASVRPAVRGPGSCCLASSPGPHFPAWACRQRGFPASGASPQSLQACRRLPGLALNSSAPRASGAFRSSSSPTLVRCSQQKQAWWCRQPAVSSRPRVRLPQLRPWQALGARRRLERHSSPEHLFSMLAASACWLYLVWTRQCSTYAKPTTYRSSL